MTGVAHIDSNLAAAPTYLQWVADLVAGGQAPSRWIDAAGHTGGGVRVGRRVGLLRLMAAVSSG
jgi:hypothetical protein